MARFLGYLDELIGLASLVVDGVAMARRPITEYTGSPGVSITATDDPANTRTIINIDAGSGLSNPDDPEDDNKVAYANSGDLAYSAEFLHNPTSHTTSLNHAASRLELGAIPHSAATIGLTNGATIGWRNIAQNANYAGISGGTYDGVDALMFGVGANAYDRVVHAVGAGGKFVWKRGAVEAATYTGLIWDFTDTSATQMILRRRGVNTMSFDGDGSASNIAFFDFAVNYQSGNGILFLGNRTAAPSGNPAAGGFIYCESGALKYRGSSGTVTTVGVAEPHCPRCNRDFAVEHRNETMGHLAICLWCLTSALESAGIPGSSFLISREEV